MLQHSCSTCKGSSYHFFISTQCIPCVNYYCCDRWITHITKFIENLDSYLDRRTNVILKTNNFQLQREFYRSSCDEKFVMFIDAIIENPEVYLCRPYSSIFDNWINFKKTF